jgi:hypothetical protein
MFLPSEIQVDDIVQAIVKEHDNELEEPAYGVVQMNTGNVLGVRFLSPTEKIYKSACVYELDQEMTATPFESLTEHYAGGTFEDVEMKSVGHPYYVFLAEVDVEDDDSEIWEDDGSDLDDFIVPDDEVDEEETLPDGHQAIDNAWDAWEPRSPGARSFKDTIDMIECRARRSLDERHFASS